jgi:transcription-repair coupling factor (superfamily II helicase)
MLGMQKIRTFYEKSLEKYETLNKDIAHRTPQELFISDQEFLFDYKKFKTVDLQEL